MHYFYDYLNLIKFIIQYNSKDLRTFGRCNQSLWQMALPLVVKSQTQIKFFVSLPNEKLTQRGYITASVLSRVELKEDRKSQNTNSVIANIQLIAPGVVSGTLPNIRQ